MKWRLGALLALAALVVAVPAALGGSARTVANTQTFNDSIGEDANAPDITSVGVANDEAGNITLQINISNRPALTPDMFLLVFLDTDQNPTTGDVSALGADYAIDLEQGAVGLFQWNGSDFTFATSQTSLTYAYGSTGATIHISAADLGKTKAFNFGVVAASGVTVDANGNPNFDNVHQDNAPDLGHGFWSYQVLTKLVLSVTAFSSSPKPARSGRTFSVSLAANENDTNGPVASGAVSCAATLAGKRVAAASHVIANGVATCVWRIPKTAKGRIMRGSITLTVRDAHVTRPFTAKFA
jgi:hypothetical protein